MDEGQQKGKVGLWRGRILTRKSAGELRPRAPNCVDSALLAQANDPGLAQYKGHGPMAGIVQ